MVARMRLISSLSLATSSESWFLLAWLVIDLTRVAYTSDVIVSSCQRTVVSGASTDTSKREACIQTQGTLSPD
jgi:hypothetical protein